MAIKINGLTLTEHTDGTKMHLMKSLSTSNKLNKRCLERCKNPKSICYHCFSFSMQKQYTKLEKSLKRNTEVLTTTEIKPFKLNDAIFRFESFGDINDIDEVLHLDNYISIVKHNRHTVFGLWTKNTDLIEKYFETHAKPKNLQIQYSSDIKNEELNINDFKYADRIFTVYDKEYIQENSIKINCGQKQCIDCRKCYSKNTVKYIREKRK